MTKFKTPLAIEGNKSSLCELVPYLLSFGYKFSSSDRDRGNSNTKLLLTCNSGHYDELLFVNSNAEHWNTTHSQEDREILIHRTRVQASNKDLVLALAAMVDDDIFHDGEWVISKDQFIGVTRDLNSTIKKAAGVIGLNQIHTLNRKATKEEIINHFSRVIKVSLDIGYDKDTQVAISAFKDAIHNNVGTITLNHTDFGVRKIFNMKSQEKTIIGYKFKPEFEKLEHIAANIAFTNPKKGFSYKTDIHLGFAPTSIAEIRLKEAGVLDLWFDKVYHEEQFKEGDYVVVIDSGNSGLGCLDRIGQLVSKPRRYENGATKPKRYIEFDDQVWGLDQATLRKATPEEIKRVTVKVIALQCTGGSFTVEVNSEGVYYRPEHVWLNIDDLRVICHWDLHPYNVSIRHFGKSNSYTFTPIITHVDSGCKKNVPIKDWQKVLEVYDQIKKS